MTPRPDIVAIRSDATIDDLRRLVQEQEYSRLPVYTDNLDNIVGLVVVKDLIQRPEALAGGHKVADLMRPAAFVPETKRVMDLLREFQQRPAAAGDRRRRVRRDRGPRHRRGRRRRAGRRDPRRVRHARPSRSSAKATTRSCSAPRSRSATWWNASDVRSRTGEFETVGGYVLARVGRVPAVGRALHLRRSRRRDPRSRAPPHPQGADPAAAARRRRRSPGESRVRLARRPAERRQVHAPQSVRRPESRDRLGQAADDPPSDRRRPQSARTGRSSSSTRRASTSRCTG